MKMADEIFLQFTLKYERKEVHFFLVKLKNGKNREENNIRGQH